MRLKVRGWAIILMSLILSASYFAVDTGASDQLSLAISAALLSIPSDGQEHPAFFITVLDSKGRPQLLSNPVNVTISSSDERILTVKKWAIVKAGEYNVVVNASSDVPEKKSVEVSVSASGFQASKINAVIEPPAGTPKALKITLLPDVLIPSSGASAEVIVTIVDTYGKPAKARSDLDVTVSSSNLQIADIAEKNLRISRGSFSAKTKVVSKGFIGSAVVTASSSDLKPDSAAIKVLGPRPERLSLCFPSTFLLDETGMVFVAIVDKDLKPAKVPYPARINLYSSNTTILWTQEYVTIGVDEWSALAEVKGLKLGSVTLFALADDMAGASIKIDVTNQDGEPHGLKLYSLAKIFPADERSYTALVIQTVDVNGKPAEMAKSKNINVFSSYSDILETDSTAVIPAEKSLAYIKAVPRLPGSVKVTAASPDFGVAETSVSVYSPTPSSVSLIAPPIPSDGEVEAALQISSGGLPAPAQQDVEAPLSSSDTRVAVVDVAATIPRKRYFTLFKIRGRSPGQFSLTVSGGGIPSTSVSLPVHEVRPSNFYVSYVKPLANKDFPIVVQVISSLGSPAVVDEAITVNIASSNTSSVWVPESASIEAEKEDVLLYGKGLASGKTFLTVSSGGFHSLSQQITTESYKAGISILVGAKYEAGEEVNVWAAVTMEGKPLEGVLVHWRGAGLKKDASQTDSRGMAENVLTVQESESTIEVTASVPGLGTISSLKTVQVYRVYHLEVTSNVPVQIEGSGKYLEGAIVPLTAPRIGGMTGILGILGGRYQFLRWSGAISSNNSKAVIVMQGEATELGVKAIYIEDFSGLTIPMLVVAIAGSAGAFGIIYWRRRSGE